jgi:hypothetical protein
LSFIHNRWRAYNDTPINAVNAHNTFFKFRMLLCTTTASERIEEISKIIALAIIAKKKRNI